MRQTNTLKIKYKKNGRTMRAEVSTMVVYPPSLSTACPVMLTDTQLRSEQGGQRKKRINKRGFFLWTVAEAGEIYPRPAGLL